MAGDFVLGERVWVNGVKPGVIAYLGETQFSPGQWAGVVLNDLVGKNDGSVNGVRYFECQPLQGIFTRPSKLTRQLIGEGGDEQQQNSQQQGGTGASGQRVVMPLREGMLNSSVKTGNESGSNMSDSGSVKKGGEKDLKVGDRVLVSIKVGFRGSLINQEWKDKQQMFVLWTNTLLPRIFRLPVIDFQFAPP